MARPANPPFTLGRVAVRPHPTLAGQVQARGYFNDGNSKRREVSASGKTEAAAKRALQAKVNTARDEFKGGDSTLNSDTRVGKAAAVWFDYCQRQRSGGRALAPSTLEQYAGNVSRYIEGSTIEHLTVVQVNNVARIESWLEGIADNNGEGAARSARKILSGVLALAERRGAIPVSVMHRVETPGAKVGSAGDSKCNDTECDYECGKRHLNTRRAFTLAEAVAVQEQADASRADVGDLAAFLFSTGARISEALHCVGWNDLDLDAVGEDGDSAPTVRINGTKTEQSRRTVGISVELAERLRKRGDLHGRTGLVFGVTRFATKVGQPRETRNVAKSLRIVFDKAGVPWAGSHTFRRTVATWMDAAGAPLAEIANQLGHANVNVTAGYLGWTTAPTRAATVMRLPAKPELRVISGG